MTHPSGTGRLPLSRSPSGLSRPLPPRPALEEGTDDQQRHDGDDLAAQDHAVHIEGRLPANVAVTDEEGADRASHKAEAAPAPLTFGIAAASSPAPHGCRRHQHAPVLLAALAEDALDRPGVLRLRDHVLYV